MSEPGAITPERTPAGVRVRFRLPRSSYLTVLFVTLGVSALMVRPWFAFLYVVPLVLGLFIARRGTDVDANGVTVHALLRSERFVWSGVRGVVVTDRGRVQLGLGRAGGSGGSGGVDALVTLPCVTTTSLPVLAEASGGAVPQLQPATIKAAPGRARRR